MSVLILFAAAVMLILAVLMAWVLGWANRTFHVQTDPRVDAVNAALPGANCGGCGYVGCNDYAEAVVLKNAAPDLCPVGGTACAEAVAAIMGVTVDQRFPFRPVVHCGATDDKRLLKSSYTGEHTCMAANVIGGVQGCSFGCLGFGDCERSCAYDAIHTVNGLARVDYEKCIGCGACARVCPRNIIHMVPFKKERMIVVACSSKDPGKQVREVCKVGCIGCGGCARRADDFGVSQNLSVIDYDKYDPDTMADAMQLALEKCPMKTIVTVGKPGLDELAAVANTDLPAVIKDEFQTTVDDTEWRG